jgi:hypothetical protein
MTMEPTGTTVGSDEMPSIAAEIIIVLDPDPASDDAADGGDPVTAGRNLRRDRFVKLRARLFRHSE